MPDATLLDGIAVENLQVHRCAAPRGRFNRGCAFAVRNTLLAGGELLLAWRLLDKLLKTQLGFIPDVVVSSSAPYEVHLVGEACARLFGLPWIADFRDPYTLNVNYRKRLPTARWGDRAFERMIYARAAGVIFNTERNRADACREFGLDRTSDQHYVCQNGYDPEDLQAVGPPPAAMPFVISYLGGVRGAAYEHSFIDLVIRHAELLREQGIVFRLIGNGAELLTHAARKARGVLEIHKFRPQRELWECFTASHAFFFALPPSRQAIGWVPQKLYTYLATGRPVLGLVPEGEARDYLHASGRNVVRDPGDTDLPEMVRELRERAGRGWAADSGEFAQTMLFGRLTQWLQQRARQ